ncbi:serine hydrolase domain-containing protein [Nocardia sp. NPDC050717]|uniref:serine hydrolase domain-containing protein n=1 Tax=Nocardia sp. NPDC050717 TaxID=3157221 RepID=UPI00340D7BEE
MTLDLARTRARITELLAEYGIPSAAVGVLRDGERAEFAVGVRNVDTREPATTDTVYQIGSMTKTWTALTFLQLVDEGRADLDAPVRTYLPDFTVADPHTSAELTARHLLHHTNGIEETYGDPGEDDDVYQRLVADLAGARQVFPLGHTHGYSAAVGYAVLARILEVLDGKPWDTVMRDRLFDPMGLTSTNTWHEQVDRTRAATGHLLRAPAEGPFVTPIDHLPRAFGPGGNITSTIGEVLALAQALLGGGLAPNGKRVVSAATLREMMNSHVPVPDPYLIGHEWALGLIMPDLPTPDPSLRLDPARYEGVYGGPDARYEISAENGNLYLTMVLDPMRAELLHRPDCLRYDLLPVTETHFLMPPTDPTEDTQTVAVYDFTDGHARYLHTNCRANPRLDAGS